MVRLDPDAVRELVDGFFVSSIVREHGEPGGIALRKLLIFLHKLYFYVAPDNCRAKIVVFKTIDDSVRPVALPATIVHNLDTLVQEVREGVAIQVLESGQLLLWHGADVDTEAISSTAVVYIYENGMDYFVTAGSKKPVPKLLPVETSIFAIPTFVDLRSALEHYQTKWVRRSSCEILSAVWRDSNRLFFKNAQEFAMRRSLTQFLKISLRDLAEVRPEQIVDESHPVDIKVTWLHSQRIALIEIKWLGMPKYDDGHLGTAYTDQRAREGAQQLADYLDSNLDQVPTHSSRGYLVLIDGRRRGLREDSVQIDRANGMHYQDKDIQFDPKFHEMRNDFEIPIRMFVEPICL
jgi:hypothetical protein